MTDTADTGAGQARAAAAGMTRYRMRAMAMLAVAAALSLYLSWPRRAPSQLHLARDIPLQLGEWRGIEHELDQRTLEILGTDDVLSRTYVTDREGEIPVTFLVIFARHTRRATHPPEICLHGEGYSVDNMRTVDIDLGPGRERFPVRELIISRSGQRRLVYYFFKHAERYSANYWGHQMRVAMAKLINPGSSDTIIRADSVISPPRDVEGARRRAETFLRAVIGHVDACLPKS